MKESRIKSIIATITASRPGVDPVTILNGALEDDKEYVVCSSLATLIKKEEKDLEKKKEEEEEKKKKRGRRSAPTTSQFANPRSSTRTIFSAC